MNPDQIKSQLKGNIVPVPAQYYDDLSINYSALKEHMMFLIDKGVKCFYLAMSASEFDYMTQNERVAVTECVAKTLMGDCVLIAQALGGHWFEEQMIEAKRMVDSGAHAIVIAPRGIKEGGKFFSSNYLRGTYEPQRHDDYFVTYIEKMGQEIKAPIVYHDKPFANGRGPSIEMLRRIAALTDVIALKEHISDPGKLRKVYTEFGDQLVCFDGFGKTVQFWSLLWGARARHTCWSWFDPDNDNKFMSCMQSEDLTGAVQIILNEAPIADAIAHTGFQGYKYIMKLMGLPSGPVRIPGEAINKKQKEMIKKAVIRVGLLS